MVAHEGLRQDGGMSGARILNFPQRGALSAGAPSAQGLLPRERLFERLDTLGGRAAWLVAPAGYGKSSLAASYVQARARPCVWLRAGAADAEPAGFFANLTQASGASLPVLQREQLAGGLAAFARRYFQALWAALPATTVLVIDEVEAVAGALQQMLAEAVASLGPAQLLVVTSRAGPPAALARAEISGALQRIEATALALTAGEIGRLLERRHRPAAAADVDVLLRRTLGWPAAVSLMLDAGQRLPEAGGDVLAHYLEHEVWPTFDAPSQSRLRHAAQLPYVDAALESAWPALQGASAMLGRYAERGLFVMAAGLELPRYVLHPLIREFLRREAEATLDPDALATLRRDAARALAMAGDLEAAVPMLQACGAFDEAVAPVLKLAPRLFGQARLRTLDGWLAAFPSPLRERFPYLEYWLALVRLMAAPGRAREHLMRAYESFRAQGDAAGRLRTLAHLAYLSFIDVAPDYPVTRWLGELQEVTPRFDELPTAEEKAQVAMVVVYALLVGEPAHPELPRWRERVVEALHAPIALQLRARLASVLGINLLWSGLFDQIGAMHELLVRQVAAPGLSDYGQLVFGLVELDACWAQERLDDAPGVLERLLATADESGIHVLDTYHRLLASDALLAAGRIDEARAVIDKATEQMLPAQLTEVWHAAFQRAWLMLWRGDAPAVLAHAQAAVDAARALRSPMCEAFGVIARCLAHRLSGSTADVAAELPALRTLAAHSGSTMVDFHVQDLSAWLARCDGEPVAEAEALAAALGALRRHAVRYPALGTHAALAETAAAALAHGVELPFVRDWIVARGLPAPAEPPPGWPHPLHLQLLGEFEVQVRGEPLVSDGKQQKRPLELLQAVALHGPGPVPVSRLLDDLWPELDGDAARKAFDAALLRLRRLLGEQGAALRLDGGALRLDPAVVGCDLWVLRCLAAQAPDALRAQAYLQAWAQEQAAAELLPAQVAPWALPERERHQRRMALRFDAKPAR